MLPMLPDCPTQLLRLLKSEHFADCLLLQDTNAAVVTVAVAMISHKWVESLALSTFCIRAGARWWHLVLVLIPFGLMAFIGVAIGVSVTDSSTWAELVLFGLISGEGLADVCHETCVAVGLGLIGKGDVDCGVSCIAMRMTAVCLQSEAGWFSLM